MASTSALGILETRGMTALVGATDAMLKVAQVDLCGRHGVGSGWVTVAIQGEVASVQTALATGREMAESLGEIITSQVIARPQMAAMQTMPHREEITAVPLGGQALGILETQGLAPLIAGADAMVKGAAVELAGWAFIGGALLHTVIRGDVAAVQTALELGRQAAAQVGPVHASLVIPQPDPGLGPLMPPPPQAQGVTTGALGVVETTGYTCAVAGADAMVKAADVEVLRLTIGSGGRIAVLAQGSLDAMQAAVDAGAQAIGRLGETNAVEVVSRPSLDVMACFGGLAEAPAPILAGRAMGLIETRSTIALVKAVDQMLKSADVEYDGSYKVGYYLTAAVLRGDVGAVQVALDAGAVEGAKYGEVVAVHLIPYPFAELEGRLSHLHE
ncbi:MAG: BMC domain-containing protein [Candidatus Latescibacteria bacterium]|nr:BMC domain-containing protein [Candidatus Latescibacterota bacterium]